MSKVTHTREFAHACKHKYSRNGSQVVALQRDSTERRCKGICSVPEVLNQTKYTVNSLSLKGFNNNQLMDYTCSPAQVIKRVFVCVRESVCICKWADVSTKVRRQGKLILVKSRVNRCSPLSVSNTHTHLQKQTEMLLTK